MRADEFGESMKDGEVDVLDEVEAIEPPKLAFFIGYSRFDFAVLLPPLEAVTLYFIILLNPS